MLFCGVIHILSGLKVCCGQCTESGGSSWSHIPPVHGSLSLQVLGGLGQVVATHSVVMDNLRTLFSLLVGFTILSANFPHTH